MAPTVPVAAERAERCRRHIEDERKQVEAV
jgi:hypothetical protein